MFSNVPSIRKFMNDGSSISWALSAISNVMRLLQRTEFKSALAAALLKEDGVLAMPTVSGAPPKMRMDAALLEDFRARAFFPLSIAGLSGFCQVSIPLGTHGGVPVLILLAPCGPFPRCRGPGAPRRGCGSLELGGYLA